LKGLVYYCMETFEEALLGAVRQRPAGESAIEYVRRQIQDAQPEVRRIAKG
jgi:hypothetical protein